MQKPVTELYEAAKAQWLGEDAEERLDSALSEMEKLDPTNDRVLLRLLDLVASHPTRLGLVRWVAGLNAAQIEMLRMALQLQRVSAVVPSSGPLDLLASFTAAFSGGEGGAKEMDTKPREPGCQCHIEEGDSPCLVHGEEEDKPKRTILPAGKPPPFLRVGMVLCVPGAPCGELRICGEEVDGRVQVSGIDGSTWLASVSRLRASWVLAEPFRVEGES